MRSLILTAYVILIGFGFWLKYLNLTYLKAHARTVPPEFEGMVDSGLLGKISDYTFENSRTGIVESIIGNLVLVVFLFGGALGAFDRWIASQTTSFLFKGALFFLALVYAEMLMDVPFSLYRNFRTENRYGFNTMTVRLWFIDLVKSIAIATAMGLATVIAALAIVQASPAWWWLWVWGFFLLFGIFIMYISPYVIEPLFFKFEPVKVEGL